jgi:TonB family protein
VSLKYDDFDVQIEPAGDKYRVRLLNAPTGQASTEFVLPFTEIEVGNFLSRIGQVRRSMRRVDAPELHAAKEFGGKLFNAIFSGEMIAQLRGSMEQAADKERGLRIRLRLTDVPALGDLPWEFLYDANQNHFLTTSSETPLVRFLDLPQRIAPLRVALPLRVLVVIAGPANLKRLDTQGEWQRLQEALGDLLQGGSILLERLPSATLDALRLRARGAPFHVLHFIGHGGFDTVAQDGVLQFEDESGMSYPVRGELLGMLLRDHRSLRLAVLNACEGARSSRQDPFSGVAQSLLQQRVPAVIAMQFEISDVAAKVFAQEFYRAVAEGNPVDAAVCESRKALFKEEFGQEWATPVLYMRSQEGQLFELQPAAPPLGDDEVEKRVRAEAERQGLEKIERERRAMEKAEAQRAASVERERLAKEARDQRELALRNEAERHAGEQAARERLEHEKAEAERAASVEKERLAKEARDQRELALRNEVARRAGEQAARERLEHEKAEAERAASVEKERLAKEARDQRELALRNEADRLRREKADGANLTPPGLEKKTTPLLSLRAWMLLIGIPVVGMAAWLALFHGTHKKIEAPSDQKTADGPSDAAAHNRLGNSRSQKGDLDGAIAEYRESLRQNPQNAETHYALGGVLERKGEHDLAVAEYRETLRLEPDFAKSHAMPELPAEEKKEQAMAPSPPVPVITTKKNPVEKSTAKRIFVGGSVQETKLATKVQPVYPPLARQTKVAGTVRLHVIIGKDGTVQEVDVLSGHPLLLQSAMKAVKQWRYKPTLLNGQPVEVETNVDVIYSLTNGSGAPANSPQGANAPIAGGVASTGASPPANKDPCTLRNIEFREQGNTLMGTVEYSYQGSSPLDAVAVRGVPLTGDKQPITGLNYGHSTLKVATGSGYFSIEDRPSLGHPNTEGKYVLVSIFVKQTGAEVCSQTVPYQRKW